MSKKVAVSGANGFLGRAVLGRLIEENHLVMAFVRNTDALRVDRIDVDVASLVDRSTWPEALQQCAVFIHCAGRGHITLGPGRSSLPEFRQANTELTLNLARSAAAAGVRRFVFVSSIGVNGLTSGPELFAPDGVPKPETPYAISKYEAELGLNAISRETGLEVVVVRPPLVYGADAPGNFGTLMAMLSRGLPLPLGAVTRNLRSYVALPNLVDLLLTVCSHPAAANQVFLVSDGEDLSTADLVRRLSVAMGRPSRLWPVPPALLKMGTIMLGRSDLAQRLLGDLRVDISKTRQVLGWSPPVSVETGLCLAVKGCLSKTGA